MNYKIGMKMQGKVTGLQPYGAFVSLKEETQGLIHISEIQHGYIKNIKEVLHVGDHITVKIIDIDEYSKKISLSLRALEKRETTMFYHKKKYFTNRQKNLGFSTIEMELPAWIEEGIHQIEKKN